jgi:hypothetical protein
VGNGHPAALADHFSLVLGQTKSPPATLPVHRGAGQPENASCTFHPSGRYVLPDFQASPATLKDFGFWISGLTSLLMAGISQVFA